ncbi:MAG: RnfABCDGE type electron transport complex subunit D [Chitinispirillaceae bacterium]|nr:RnfABCDGE type electron transport complex subunit D [Chitinispirillaceae bacterium]
MKNTPLLTVSFRPFRYSRVLYTHVNYLFMLLLLPAVVQGALLFGLYAVRIISASIAACMLWDILFEKMFRRGTRLYDGSAALAGMLLGMLFPPLAPWWIVVFAAGAAMFLGRQLFGGAGNSPFNAVCIGWAVVMVSWPGIVDPTYGSVGLNLPCSIEYPLSELRRLGAAALPHFPVSALLMGKQAGCVGTGASLSLLIGGSIGMALGVIPWVIPVSFLGAMAFTAAAFSIAGQSMAILPLFYLLTGFSLIGAFFLAADFSSRPVSFRIMIWYGTLSGVLTVLFRMWSGFPEGLPFALLIANMAVPMLDRGGAPKGPPVAGVRRI